MHFRIDCNSTIKVADFGLSRNTYEKIYFRQQKTEAVKLPVKWLAMESMVEGIFSEKTDVVWEMLYVMLFSNVELVSNI